MFPSPTITLNVSNGVTTLDVASVSISLNGSKLDHEVSEGTGLYGTSYSITAATAKLAGGSENTVSATFKDSAGESTTLESSFTVTDNLALLADAGTVKYIEVEDFNYDGGSWKTFEEVGTGGAYDGLGAVSGIDLNNSGHNSPNYRDINPHPGMTGSMWDSSRNGFNMEVDFKMGWNGGGEWWNYTRDFPEADTYYHVYGRFSSGGGSINNKLSIVTSDATAADQTIEDVGVFQGPRTAGWNSMEFFPMTDSTGNLGVVKIGGVTTVRLSMVGGNMDANYLAFVKAAVQSYPPLLVSTSPSGAADSSAVIQAVLKARDIALADASITVNGEAANVETATDGDIITLTVTGNPSKLGNNDVSLSFNGQTTEWSYFYYGDEYTEDGLNLLASWDFNDGTVDSVSGIEGTLVGGATLTDGALDVRGSGNAAMLVEDAVFMNIASAMNKLTVAFWQKVETRTSSSSFWAFSPSTGSGGRAAQAHSPWGGGDIFWDTAGCCGGDTRMNKAWGGDYAAWNHYAFVKNGDAKEIYMNGELHHSGSNNGVLPGDISRLAVGAMIDSATSQGGNSVDAQIDDFKVFAQGLTQDQIKSLAGVAIDISSPGDTAVPTSDNHPAGEHAGLAIDNDSSTKYLNFDGRNDEPSGLTITTGGGVVTGLGLTSANDAPDRDPTSFVLSGSNDGGATFTEIASGDVPAFGDRFERQEVSFDNSAAYTVYHLIFPTTAGPSTCCMQIAEIELLGTAAEPTREPGLVAHFPLDSDGDSSDGGFKASKVTDVTFGAAGANAATGTSASFNGSSSVIQHDWSADLNPEGSFTLALWARSDGGAGAWNSPVTSRHDLYNEGEASQGYLIYDNNPSGVWTFWSGNGDVAGNWQILDGPAVNIGEWDHLAIVYDSEAEMKKLYVNGALEAESNDIVAPNDTTPLNIGAGADFGGTFWFKGDIDDIGLWNLALSQEEIQDVMNNGVVPGDGPPAAPALSIVNNGDGTLTVTFEGRLEAAASVNGPWQDTGLTSPATIDADQAQQYGRAVLD